jgi:hypothetical protein
MKKPRPGVSAGRKSKPLPAPVPAKKAVKKRALPPEEVDPAQPLKNVKHETAVGFVLKGLSFTDAYLATYGGTRQCADSAGPRLFGTVRVKARLAFLKAQATERVVARVALDKEEVVRWCLQVRDTPITTVAHAVNKHQLLLLSKRDEKGNWPEGVAELTEEERAALLLAHEIQPSEYGLKVKAVGKLDGLKLAVEVLGLKKADEDADKNGKGIVDGLAALAAAVRSRAGGEGAK